MGEKKASCCNSGTFAYVVHLTYKKEIMSNNKVKNRIYKREKREKYTTDCLIRVNLVCPFGG